MSVFDLSIKPTPLPCASTDYLFYIATPAQAMKEGESVFLTIVGGVAPYDWESFSPGVSILTAQTTELTNTLTVDALPYGKYAHYKVTDACGVERTSAVAVWDDFSFDCHAVGCDVATELTLTGPLVDVDAGSQYTAGGGVAPYRYRVTHGAIDSTGQVVGFYDLAADTYQIQVTVIDTCGGTATIEGVRVLPPVIVGPVTPIVGEIISGSGCDDDMRFSINCGEIDKRTGEILSLDGCDCEPDIIVTGEDGCGQDDDSSVANAGYSPVVLSGTEDPVVGSVYSASGGLGSYEYSFNGGTIDSVTGEVLTITTCGGAINNGAVGTITVSDDCGSAELNVRLPGGTWYNAEQHTQRYGCGLSNNYVLYAGGIKYSVISTYNFRNDFPEPLLNSEGVIGNGACPNGVLYTWENSRNAIGITVPGFTQWVVNDDYTAKECEVHIEHWYCC